jgi:multidrug efflux system outer membrane protein
VLPFFPAPAAGDAQFGPSPRASAARPLGKADKLQGHGRQSRPGAHFGFRISDFGFRISSAAPFAQHVCLILLAALAGCAVGPDYKRPAMDGPTGFRRAATDTNAPSGTNSLADLGWWETFQDPQLTAYVAEALTNSWDIKITAARVLQAEAAARITRSQFFPTINAGGDVYTTRTSEKGPVPIPPGVNPQRGYGDVFLSMPAYEVDLWGRLRRANEAARAQLLATIEAQRTVRQTLVAEVATAYLDLLEFDLELDIAVRTFAVRTNSLELTQSRAQGGVASMADVYQSKILVFAAEASVADIHRRIEQQENLLSILLGRNPGGIQRGPALISQTIRAEVPPGLPSSLLERRPDLRAAEQQLVSANADIGQAKAAFYPQVTLTGFAGFQSVALSDLFTGAAKTWQFGPAVTVPLFTGGRLRANLKQAEARFQESLARYQQTVQGAFREVSDGLVAFQRTREFRARQEERTQANRDATELANTRYEGGVTSYLEVLYNEQELFSAELNLALARRNEFLSVIQLYRALGGGWTEPAAPQTASVPTRN